MNNKLLIAGVIAASALLGGCAKHMETEQNISELTNQVNALSEKVDGLAADYKNSQSEIQAAASSAQTAVKEAERANMRIDNIADSYKK